MSYFTYIHHSSAITSLISDTRNTSMTINYATGLTIVEVMDVTGVNTLKFYMSHIPSIDEQSFLCEQCRRVAYQSNGSTRHIVEDTRVMHMMKECNLNEVYHTSRDDSRSRGTLWTPEDADALLN
jgi:hypothetical protein